MEGGRGAWRVKRSEPAHGLAGRQRLYGHAALPELLERGGIGPHAAVGAGAHDQMRRKLVQGLDRVVEHAARGRLGVTSSAAPGRAG